MAGRSERGCAPAPSPSGPPAEPWSVVLEDPHAGTVRLSGHLRARDARAVLVVVHGLAGDAEAPYVIAAARAADAAGLACLRVNLRGADRKGDDFYHAGLTADLHAAVKSRELAGYDQVFVLGYSLGGHVTLRYAADSPDRRVAAVAAISAPLDLDVGARAFDSPWCEVYRRNILVALNDIYANVARRRAVPTPVAEARRIRKIREWDNRIVAPRYGFENAEHYYQSVSAAPWLPKLTLPSLLLYARHDPVVPAHAVERALEKCVSGTEVHWVERGGHMGFSEKLDLGYGGPLGLEMQVMSWFLSGGVSRRSTRP